MRPALVRAPKFEYTSGMVTRTLAAGAWLAALPLALCLGLGTQACDSKKDSSSATPASADSALGKPPMDSRIAKAVESAARQQDAGAGQGDGPPQNGVFGPGDADRAMPKGAPRKLQVLEQGSEPRVVIRPKPSASWPKAFKLTVAQRIGPQAVPTLEYTLAPKVEQPKDAADKKGEGDKPAAAGTSRVTLTVKSVGLAKSQPGSLPNGLDKEVAKLKGAKIEGPIGDDGAPGAMQLSLPKGADEGLRPVLQSMLDALELLWVPAPDQPIGAGGYWMVVDRAEPIGIDVVRYRVYRLKEMNGQQLTLAVDARQYSVGGPVRLGGGAEGPSVTPAAFDSAGQGTLTLSAGAPVASAFQLGLPLRMQIATSERPGQAMVLQAELKALVGAAPAGDEEP